MNTFSSMLGYYQKLINNHVNSSKTGFHAAGMERQSHFFTVLKNIQDCQPCPYDLFIILMYLYFFS